MTLNPIAWGVTAVLLLDTAGSIASRVLGFRYARLVVCSFLIYLLVGLSTARTGSLGAATVAGAAVSFVEATLGWAIAWFLGPGRLTKEQATAARILRAIATVTMSGGLFGLLGAALYWLVFGRHAVVPRLT